MIWKLNLISKIKCGISFLVFVATEESKPSERKYNVAQSWRVLLMYSDTYTK